MIVKQVAVPAPSHPDAPALSHPDAADPAGAMTPGEPGGCERPAEACDAFGDHPEEHAASLPHVHAGGVIGVLQALSDPMRLAIVRRLAAGSECACGALGMPISKSTLTHHLHILRAAGVILQREEGTRRMTSLDRDGLERRFPGLLDSVLAAPDQEPEPLP